MLGAAAFVGIVEERRQVAEASDTGTKQPDVHVIVDHAAPRPVAGSASTIAPRIDAASPGAAARDSVPDRLDGRAVLQGEAQHHGGVAGRALDVLPGLAAVDEDFAERAVWIAPDGDGEVLIPEPQVEGSAARRWGRVRRVMARHSSAA